jgi:hypothetical protein
MTTGYTVFLWGNFWLLLVMYFYVKCLYGTFFNAEISKAGKLHHVF